MLVSEETLLQEIAHVLTDAAYDTVDVVTALSAIKAREKQKRIEKQRAAMEAAMNSIYRIALVEQGVVHDAQTGQPFQANKIIDVLTVSVRDLPAFAKARGLDYDLLKRVAENRASQATNKQGERYQAYPLVYIEPEDRTAELEEDARDAERERAYITAVNARKEQAQRDKAMPRFINWTPAVERR